MALDYYSLALARAMSGDYHSHSPQLHARTRQPLSPNLSYGAEPSNTFEQSHQRQPHLNLDYGDSPHTRLTQATSSATMGNQKMITPKKSRGRPRGGGGVGRAGSVSRGRDSQSATPGATGSEPKLKLKLKIKGKGNAAPSGRATPVSQYDEQPEEDDALPVVPEVTTRTGRTIRAPKHLDDVDYSPAFGLSSDQVDEDEDEYQPRIRNDQSYTPRWAGAPDVYTLSQEQQGPKKPRGRPRKNTQKQSMDKIDEEDAPSSQTITGNQRVYETDNREIYEILDSLRSTPKIHLDLPALTLSPTDPEKPYSAKVLTELYIASYRSKYWDLCDMIADTWIRAFHEVRGSRWRPNPALERRKRKAAEYNRNHRYHIPSEFDPSPKDYGLTVDDPELEHDATIVHTDLVNELYKRTGKDCGARMLWADTMALGGDKMEKFLERVKRAGFELHNDLVFNVMQTGLRMCRRNMTLKIEESTEGAWCKRYHEHAKYGLPCYREKAWQLGQDGCEGEDEVVDAEGNVIDQAQQDLPVAFMQEEEGEQGTKRGVEEVDDGEISPTKRTRFADDVDAEGDSEEE